MLINLKGRRLSNLSNNLMSETVDTLCQDKSLSTRINESKFVNCSFI